MSKVQIDPAKTIERLGGNGETARLCEVTKGAVSQWLNNGIPKTQLKFLRLARPDVFDDLALIEAGESAVAPVTHPA